MWLVCPILALALHIPPPRPSIVGTSEYLHVHGIPWELSAADVVAKLTPMLPHGITITETLLPLDRRARTTGRVLLQLTGEGVNAGVAVAAFEGRFIGERWLEARASTHGEFQYQAREIKSITERVRGRARQAYCRPAQGDRPAMPVDERDFVLLCHGTSDRIVDGSFELNNLPHGACMRVKACERRIEPVRHDCIP